MSAPRVLLVLEATIGGTRRHLRDLALGLRRIGWLVDIALAQRRDLAIINDISLYRQHGIDVFTLPMRRGLEPVSDIVSMLRLRRIIVTRRPDIIHAHSSKAGALARLALPHRSAPPLVYTPHCFAFEMRVSRLRRHAYRLTERLLRTRTSRLIAVSRREAALAASLGYPSEAIVHIPNGIDAPSTSSAQQPKYSAVFIGRFSQQKGYDTAAEALSRLGRGHPDKLFAMMGAKDGDPIPANLPPNVTVLPFSSEAEALGLLRDSLILLHPSRWEAMPYMILEAMATQTAICASDIAAIADLVTHGEEALLCPCQNADAFANSLEQLIADPALRRRLAAAAGERVRHSGVAPMVDATASLYHDTIAIAKKQRKLLADSDLI